MKVKERQKERQHKGWEETGTEREKREGNLKGRKSKEKDHGNEEKGKEGRGRVAKDTRREIN